MARLTWEVAEKNYEYSSPSPLYSVDLTKDEEVLKWVNNTLSILFENSRDRIERAHRNIALFKGVYNMSEPLIGGRDYPTRKKQQSRLLVNHIQDLCIQKVSKLTKARPITTVVPPTSEPNDKIDALTAEEVLNSIKYDNDVDLLYVNSALQAILEGEVYFWIMWDDQKGDLHPDWKKVEEGEEVALLDADGEPVKDVNGSTVYIKKSVYQGDVRFFLSHTWETFLDPAPCPERVNYVIHVTPVHIEELKKRYPELKDEIQPQEDLEVINSNTYLFEKLDNHTNVITVYHKSMEFMEDGVYFRCTPSLMLEKPRKNPVSRITGSDWGNLPVRRLTDVDITGELHGFPSVNNIAPLQDFYDKLTTLMGKNIFWASHVRAYVQEGSVSKAEITNDSLIVNVRPGFQPPVFQSSPAFTADVFNFWTAIESKMEKVFGIFSISRGAPPPGTRAAASLYFYDEQEAERSSLLQRKLNKLVVDIDRLTLAIIADNYKDHDKRLIKILGKDNSWMVQRFRVDSLRKSYDIRVENSPNLPQSRAAKMDYLIKAKQMAPTLITDEQIGDILELGNYERYTSASRLARFSAEEENEAMTLGKDTPEPQAWEDHIVHWKAHVKDFQSPAFKTYSDSVREAKISHLRAHEMFMDDLRVRSPAYNQLLMTIPQFPIFFEPPPPPPMPMGMEMEPGMGMEPEPLPPEQPQPAPNGAGAPVPGEPIQ